ncbi:MAG: hypothetical protein GC146_04675 [Limimaricola sp.]|uniref:hypothetical protein n=1 Tax=Limimaricola sp. TaxID=2211665 RepID=UPI001DB08746|nr:hypothetical protein [Limimaricola sp.]MBI1416499.1 hypothetical protein [Limimaricola sp.]
MAGRPPPPVFLASASYRQRRLRDAARLLPVVGMVLFLVPLLWPDATGLSIPLVDAEPVRNSNAMIYLFLVWIGLVAAAALLSVFLRSDPETPPGGEDRP